MKFIKKLGVAALVAGVSLIANAGSKGVGDEKVYVTSTTIAGTLSEIYNNSTTDEYIMVMVSLHANNNSQYAYVFARSHINGFKGCVTTEPGIIELLKTVDGESNIGVSHDDKGKCMGVTKSASSVTNKKEYE